MAKTTPNYRLLQAKLNYRPAVLCSSWASLKACTSAEIYKTYRIYTMLDRTFVLCELYLFMWMFENILPSKVERSWTSSPISEVTGRACRTFRLVSLEGKGGSGGLRLSGCCEHKHLAAMHVVIVRRSSYISSNVPNIWPKEITNMTYVARSKPKDESMYNQQVHSWIESRFI